MPRYHCPCSIQHVPAQNLGDSPPPDCWTSGPTVVLSPRSRSPSLRRVGRFIMIHSILVATFALFSQPFARLMTPHAAFRFIASPTSRCAFSLRTQFMVLFVLLHFDRRFQFSFVDCFSYKTNYILTFSCNAFLTITVHA